MKKVLSKYIKTVLGLVVILLVLIWVSGMVYSAVRENSLLKKYAADPERKQFIEWIKRNQNDLAQNPKKAQEIAATMDMGLQWYNLRAFDLAAKWWKRGLKIEPDNDIGWYNLGNAYLELHHYWRAVRAYKKSMYYAAPGEIEGCLALGELYRYAYVKKREKEDDVYLECFKKHPNNRDLIARLAIYYRDIGDKKNAVLYFDKLFSIEPTAEVSEELRNLRLTE